MGLTAYVCIFAWWAHQNWQGLQRVSAYNEAVFASGLVLIFVFGLLLLVAWADRRRR